MLGGGGGKGEIEGPKKNVPHPLSAFENGIALVLFLVFEYS